MMAQLQSKLILLQLKMRLTYNPKNSFDSGIARVIVSGGGGSESMLPWEILKSRVPQMRFPAF